jgi:hypothetical protein
VKNACDKFEKKKACQNKSLMRQREERRCPVKKVEKRNI